MNRDVAPASPDAGESFAGMKVLVADDTSITMAMMTARLNKLGCEVAAAENGQQAVARAQEQNFDCIFMDYHMPIMDGVEATKLIRQAEAQRTGSARQSYIVAFTATSQESDRTILMEAGMDDFLAKPMSVPDLLAVLRRAASRQ